MSSWDVTSDSYGELCRLLFFVIGALPVGIYLRAVGINGVEILISFIFLCGMMQRFSSFSGQMLGEDKVSFIILNSSP